MDVYRAYGLTIAASFPLPGMASVRSFEPADIYIALADIDEIEEAWSRSRDGGEAVGQVHGGPLRVTLGQDGDNLITYADHAVFHVSAGGARILCCPASAEDPQWQRELLDTVLWLTALAHGREIVHASAIEGSAGALAIVAQTGGGKTSLAAELVRRGSRFFCDDVLALDRCHGGIQAYPAPPLMNLPDSFADDVPSSLGHTIARIDGEIWTAVRNASDHSRELAAICFLERRASDVELELSPIQATAIDLLPHMLTHPFLPEREPTTFLMCSDLLETVPTWRIRANAAVPPEALADLISELPSVAGSHQVERAV